MTIDSNTIVLVAVSSVALFFAGAYLRMKINERIMQVQRVADDHATDLYQTVDKIWREIHNLERKVECCRNSKRDQQPCDKNYYNSQA